MRTTLLPSFYKKNEATSGPAASKVRRSAALAHPKRPLERAEYWLASSTTASANDALAEKQQRHQKSHALGFLGCLNIGVTEVREYQGTLFLPRVVNVYALCHFCTIDLTKAVYLFPETKIRVIGMFARVRVLVPRGVRVTARGIEGCGGISELGDEELVDNLPEEANSPLIRLTGVAIATTAYAKLDTASNSIVVVAMTEEVEQPPPVPQLQKQLSTT